MCHAAALAGENVEHEVVDRHVVRAVEHASTKAVEVGPSVVGERDDLAAVYVDGGGFVRAPPSKPDPRVAGAGSKGKCLARRSSASCRGHDDGHHQLAVCSTTSSFNSGCSRRAARPLQARRVEAVAETHDDGHVENEGNIVARLYLDANVRAWVEEYVEDAQWSPDGALVVEHRDVAEMLLRLFEAGFQIGGGREG